MVLSQCPIVDCDKENHECSGAHVLCKCPKDSQRIPDLEAAWLKDQRLRDKENPGRYTMQGIDWKVAATQQKQNERKAAKLRAEEAREARKVKEATEDHVEESVDMEVVDKDFNDNDFVCRDRGEPSQNRTDLDYFIAEVIMFGYSDRGAEALYNAALKTVGKISDGRDALAVDKSKIRRARESFGAK